MHLEFLIVLCNSEMSQMECGYNEFAMQVHGLGHGHCPTSSVLPALAST